MCRRGDGEGALDFFLNAGVLIIIDFSFCAYTYTGRIIYPAMFSQALEA